MSLPKLVVGITQGDSNGIGYEVIIKSLADERSLDSSTLYSCQNFKRSRNLAISLLRGIIIMTVE